MERPNREYEIRPMVCDWALDIPMGYTTFVLHFNSRNNAELVKSILEWEDAHPNETIPYQPTPPNEPLTLEQLRQMDGRPVWFDTIKRWGIVKVNREGIFVVTKSGEYEFGRCKVYRRPPEGHPEPPHVDTLQMDLCKDCYLKAFNIHCGYRGQNPRWRR